MSDRLEEIKEYVEEYKDSCKNSPEWDYYNWLIAEVKRLRSHQGWDTENIKLQRQIESLTKELDWRIRLCDDRLRSMESKDEEIESATKERDEIVNTNNKLAHENENRFKEIQKLEAENATLKERVAEFILAISKLSGNVSSRDGVKQVLEIKELIK